MSVIVIVCNENKRYLPKNDYDLPIFKHCFGGSIEVTESYFWENVFLLGLHNYHYHIIEEQ